jgi:hypothetical protein
MLASPRIARFGLVLIVVAVCLCLPACGRRLTAGNYDRLRNGMKAGEVDALLGPGKEADASEGPGLTEESHVAEALKADRWVKWQEGDRTVFVAFVEDRVVYRTRSGF